MAERTKFCVYLIFSAVMCAFIYPVVVHWTWGGGLIADIQIDDAVFSDFAGSGIVHMTGGIAAFMGALFLGPRIGKYDEDGNPRAIPGHNIPFAILGVFILWVGWFGFNPGSELLADEFVSTIAVNTMLAAAPVASAPTITIWIGRRQAGPRHDRQRRARRPGRDHRSVWCGHPADVGGHRCRSAASSSCSRCFFFDKIKIDDPVGAISVHGVVRRLGRALHRTLRHLRRCVPRIAEDAGLFYGGGIDQLARPGRSWSLIILAWVGVTTGIAVRRPQGHDRPAGVSAEEEIEGLDVLEHGLQGYAPDMAHTS